MSSNFEQVALDDSKDVLVEFCEFFPSVFPSVVICVGLPACCRAVVTHGGAFDVWQMHHGVVTANNSPQSSTSWVMRTSTTLLSLLPRWMQLKTSCA